MSLSNVKSELESRLKFAPPLNHTVAIDLGDDGKLFIAGDNTVSEDEIADPETTLTLSLETMQKIATGQSDPNMAVLMGKLKVSGKMGVALKLAGYLGD